MGSYQLKDVIKLWEQEKLTVEQVIGQLLLHLEALSGRVGALERREHRPDDKGQGRKRRKE